jgi:hypothetical protein
MKLQLKACWINFKKMAVTIEHKFIDTYSIKRG